MLAVHQDIFKGNNGNIRLQKKAESSRTSERVKWEWTRDTNLALRNIKIALTDSCIIRPFELAEPIILHPDAGGFAIVGSVKQYDGLGILRPVKMYSSKWSGAEQNYDMCDQVLLAITETRKQTCYYLEGANHLVFITWDHRNLKSFETSMVLSCRQNRWADSLPLYDFIIEHLEGNKNPVDRPSRKPHYEISHEIIMARLLATLTATTITESYGDLLQEVKAAQETNFLDTTIRTTLIGIAIAVESQWRSID